MEEKSREFTNNGSELLRESMNDNGTMLEAALERDLQKDPDHIRNDYELTFYALRRSGHHAVMVWFAYHFGVPVYVLNDIKPYSDPCKTSHFKDGWDVGSEWVIAPTTGVEEFRWQKKHCIMISVQDFDLRKLCQNADVISSGENMLGFSKKKISIMVLRDPFNLLASRLAKPVPLKELLDPNELFDAWEIYAREFIQESNFLGNKITVNFNLWFSNLAYRKTLSVQLGMPFTDAGINIVPKAGDGSSFDLTKFDGRGSEMRVLERWKRYSDDNKFRNSFRGRHTLAALYRRIFPHDEALEHFLSEIGI